MEVSEVRRRLQRAMATARERAALRRQHTADAERAWDDLLRHVAVPLLRQVTGALKAEGYAFTVSTPERSVRLALDRSRDDFIELALDTDGPDPQVVGRVRRTHGSRTIDDERPLKPGAAPDAISEDDVMDFVAEALAPWLER